MPNIFVGHYGNYLTGDDNPVFSMTSDRRTREGKLRDAYADAIFLLERIAIEYEVPIDSLMMRSVVVEDH